MSETDSHVSTEKHILIPVVVMEQKVLGGSGLAVVKGWKGADVLAAAGWSLNEQIGGGNVNCGLGEVAFVVTDSGLVAVNMSPTDERKVQVWDPEKKSWAECKGVSPDGALFTPSVGDGWEKTIWVKDQHDSLEKAGPTYSDRYYKVGLVPDKDGRAKGIRVVETVDPKMGVVI